MISLFQNLNTLKNRATIRLVARFYLSHKRQIALRYQLVADNERPFLHVLLCSGMSLTEALVGYLYVLL